MLRPWFATMALAAIALSLDAQTAPRPAQAGLAAPATVKLVVAMVRPDLTVQPIPLHELTLTSEGTPTVTLRTGLDGTASASLAPGRWHFASVKPVEANGLRMSWALDTTLVTGQALTLELTNANAAVEQLAPVPAAGGRTIGPEVALYTRVRTGVVQIRSGLSSGSGFLVDSSGLVITNAHVVSGQASAAVVLDTVTQVPAQIIVRADNADIAVLRISPEFARGRAVLPLRSEQPLVEAGERLIAIGYPLHQEQTMTSGIASSIREGAIISDVNINHGNSGGPLLNMAGEVVGVNAFGDFTSQGGPGISGAIVIGRALSVLDSARLVMATLPIPGNATLPGIPPGRFRLETLKATADTADILRYSPLWDISVGKFTVELGTPLINLVRQKWYENEVGKDRKTREARADMSQEERYSELRDYRDWMEYVGDMRAPVVTVTVSPKLGETGGSMFRRLMIGLNTKQTIRYKGDLRDAEIYRNGDRVVPILGGTTPVKQYVDNVWVDLKDVANYGVYVLPIEVFQPDANGVPPVIHVKFVDLKNPDFPSCTTLDRETVALLWNDFQPYFADHNLAFLAADPRAKNRQNIPKPEGC